MRILTATLILIATAACTKEILACTEIGCNGTLELTFAQAAWEDGTYALTADFGDGDVRSCEVTLPLGADTYCDAFAVTFDGTALVVPLATGMDESLTDVAVTLALGADVLVDESIAPAWSDPRLPER